MAQCSRPGAQCYAPETWCSPLEVPYGSLEVGCGQYKANSRSLEARRSPLVHLPLCAESRAQSAPRAQALPPTALKSAPGLLRPP